MEIQRTQIVIFTKIIVRKLIVVQTVVVELEEDEYSSFMEL